MYQHLVRNSEGEPLGFVDVLDPMEQEELRLEEMEKRNDDPWYAAACEKEHWYHVACELFAERGIKVPQSVVDIFAEEMQKKQREDEEAKAIAEVQPAVDFLNKHFPNAFEARYEYPTPIEHGYAYIDFTDWSNRPYRDEVEPLIAVALESDIYIEDYLSMSELRKREPQTK